MRSFCSFVHPVVARFLHCAIDKIDLKGPCFILVEASRF